MEAEGSQDESHMEGGAHANNSVGMNEEEWAGMVDEEENASPAKKPTKAGRAPKGTKRVEEESTTFIKKQRRGGGSVG